MLTIPKALWVLSVTTTILIYKKKAESRNWRTTKWCPIYKLDIKQQFYEKDTIKMMNMFANVKLKKTTIDVKQL